MAPRSRRLARGASSPGGAPAPQLLAETSEQTRTPPAWARRCKRAAEETPAPRALASSPISPPPTASPVGRRPRRGAPRRQRSARVAPPRIADRPQRRKRRRPRCLQSCSLPEAMANPAAGSTLRQVVAQRYSPDCSSNCWYASLSGPSQRHSAVSPELPPFRRPTTIVVPPRPPLQLPSTD